MELFQTKKKLKNTISQMSSQIEELTELLSKKQNKIDDLIRMNQIHTEKIVELQEVMTDDHKRAIDTKRLLRDLDNKENELIESIHKKTNELNKIQNQILDSTKDLKYTSDIKQRIKILDIHLSKLITNIDKKNKIIAKKKVFIRSLKDQIIELNDSILLQNFGLYEPSYNFANSEEYKDKLAEIRNQQKQMIKDKTAAICQTTWRIDESLRKGKKMIRDNIQQTLLTFNTECENAISNVKFNNFDSMEKRIDRIYDKMNKLNDILHIEISYDYYKLKIEELKLTYEYEQKKKEEREYAREQREIQRENARVQKELEEEQHKIEKEQAHYERERTRLQKQIKNEPDLLKRTNLKLKLEDIEIELYDLDKAMKNIDYRQANERAGYVYVVSNLGAFGENIYKIGMTRRLEPMDRIDELSGPSVPFHFDVHAMIFSDDAPKLETALHNAFADRKVNMVNGRKEFFNVSLKEIEDVVKKNHDRTVEFKYTPEAEQYRETLKLKEKMVSI